MAAAATAAGKINHILPGLFYAIQETRRFPSPHTKLVIGKIVRHANGINHDWRPAFFFDLTYANNQQTYSRARCGQWTAAGSQDYTAIYKGSVPYTVASATQAATWSLFTALNPLNNQPNCETGTIFVNAGECSDIFLLFFFSLGAEANSKALPYVAQNPNYHFLASALPTAALPAHSSNCFTFVAHMLAILGVVG